MYQKSYGANVVGRRGVWAKRTLHWRQALGPGLRTPESALESGNPAEE